jgi:hypothetical protein
MQMGTQNETSLRHQFLLLAFLICPFLNTGCRLVDGQDPGVQALILNSMAVSASSCGPDAAVAEAYSCQPVVSMPDQSLDVDVSQFSWELTADNTCSWIQINPTTGQVFGIPTRDQMGPCVMALRVVTAKDPSSDFVLPMTVHGPKLSFVDQNCPLSVAVENAYSCALKTQTPLENAKVTYILGSDNKCSWASVNALTGVVSGTPPLSATGSCVLAVDAAIDSIATASTKMTINVPQVSIKITADCPTTVDAGSNYACAPKATVAVNNPVYTWSLSGSNTCKWATINATTGAISGTPQIQATGPCRLDVTAQLPNGALGQASLTVYVGIKGYSQQQLTDLNADANENAGHSVAIDGNFAVIGSPNDNKGVGSASVYQFDGFSWKKVAVLAAPDSKMQSFGHAVAISGDWILVGAPNTTNTNTGDGSLVAFQRSGNIWSKTQVLTAPSDRFLMNLGSSLDMDGATAIVGTSHYNTNAAYILTRSGSTWSLGAPLNFPAVNSAEGTGRIKVALQGSIAVVADISASDTGEVHIFKFNGIAWSHSALISAPSGKGFGSSVDTYGGKVLIGSSLERGGAGIAYLYQEGTNSWVQTQSFIAIDQTTTQQCGSAVSLNGAKAVIGCSSAGRGSAYVYSSASGAWVLSSKFMPSNGQLSDHFGISVSASASNVIVGADFFDASGALADSGSAYIFTEKAP